MPPKDELDSSKNIYSSRFDVIKSFLMPSIGDLLTAGSWENLLLSDSFDNIIKDSSKVSEDDVNSYFGNKQQE